MAIEIVDLPITKGGFSLQSVNVYQRVKLLDVAGKSSNQSWRFSSLGNNYVRIHIYIYTYTYIYICIYSTCISSFGPGNAQFQSFPGAHYGTTSRSLDRGAATRKVGSWETLEATKRGTKPTKHRGISQTNSDLFSIWIL